LFTRLAQVLAEAVGGGGVVREMAPVAGANAFLDSHHRKWLHLRVRAPLPALVHSVQAAHALRAGGCVLPPHPSTPNEKKAPRV
jgi:hypothetical protein